MRSPKELQFRLRQEIANLVLLYVPPRLELDVPSPLPGLPDPKVIAQNLKGSRFEAKLGVAASEILVGRYRLLGLDLELGSNLEWRADPVHQRESDLRYFRRIPYLDSSVGDHKIVWELNRHQHLVTLAQTYLLSGHPKFLAELVRQLQSWIQENPFQRGINWASALEVAFRALSWIWIYHLVGHALNPALRRQLVGELYRHGCHLEYNLSVYFSPNTHLLGEAVALHALGALFPSFPRASKWTRIGVQVVNHELKRQVRKDGSHFEKSTYYHVYALDFFLFHYVISGKPEEFRPALLAMATYLDALMGPQRRLPLIGDDDGGRLFFPIGPKDEYGRATLATCAELFDRPAWLPDSGDSEEQAVWWLRQVNLSSSRSRVPAQSRVFADSGTVVLAAGGLWMLVNAGAFGELSAGHSHSDALSMVARYGSEDILIDPGTFTYFDVNWRNSFSGSAAHNTLRVNGREQAERRGPFAWSEKPLVRLESWHSNGDRDELVASCQYGGSNVRHRRYILFRKPDIVFILDEVTGPLYATAEQYWHTGEPITRLGPRTFRIGSRAILATCMEADLIQGVGVGWRSQDYGRKEPSPVAVVSKSGEIPILLGTVLYCGAAKEKVLELNLTKKDREVFLRIGGVEGGEARFVIDASTNQRNLSRAYPRRGAAGECSE